MDVILLSVKCQSVLVYLDDIIVFLETVEQNLNHFQRALMLLCDIGLTVEEV